MTEIENQATAPAAPAASVSDSSVSAPITPAAPVVETQATAPAVAASSEAAPSVEPTKVETVSAPSLLAAEPVAEVKPEIKPEVKVEEKKPEVKAEEKPTEVKPEEIVAPKFEAFKLPEGFQVDEAKMGEFTGLLGKLELAKGDHKSTQEVGQQLVDLFTSKLTEATQRTQEANVTYWNKIKQDRVDELKKDAYFGAGGDTTKQTQIQMEMAGFLQRNISKPALTEFRKFAVDNGIDNALPVARLINELKSKIDRYENEGGKMLPGTKPAPSKPAVGKGILNTLYGKSS